MEIWKDINGYEGLYQVSDLGRVRSVGHMGPKANAKCDKWHVGRVLLQPLGSHGYPVINLGGKAMLVHRLVAEAFIPNVDGKPQVNHKDGTKLNAMVANLEWCSQEENINHAFGNSLMPRGENHRGAKLNNKQVRLIKHLRDIKPKMSQREIGSLFGVCRHVVGNIWLNKIWNHITI